MILRLFNYSSLFSQFDLRSLSYLSKRMRPRNKMNHRRRKKMSPREFLSANLVTEKKEEKKVPI